MKFSQLGFSTNAFKRTTLIDAVRTIAKLGYAAVEIMADAPHMNAHPGEPGFNDADARQLRKVIEDCGLAVSNVNAFTGFGFPDGDTYHPTWVEPDAARRQQRIDYTRRAIELTAMIGGNRVSLQPGGPYVGRVEAELSRLFADGIAACLDAARQHSIALGIEPEPGLFIERADQFIEFKRQHFADEPLVVMNCDVGHHFCVGEDPATVIREHHALIGHVHLEDIAANRVHQHLVPGDGAMDFVSIFQALDETGYNGYITVELYPYTATAEQVATTAIERLRPIVEYSNPSTPGGGEAG